MKAKLNNTAKILLLFMLALAAAPIFDIHVHHEISALGGAEKILEHLHDEGCGEHRYHDCESESLFLHIFKHGALIRPVDKKYDDSLFVKKLSEEFIFLEFRFLSRDIHPRKRANNRCILVYLSEYFYKFNPRSPPTDC